MSRSFNWDDHTETADTPIIDFAPPVANRKARLTSLIYTPAGTAHDLTLMRCIAEVQTTAAAAAAATSLVLNSASFPSNTGAGTQDLASGDYVIVEYSDGTFGMHLVSNLSTLTITINAIPSGKAVNSGASVWIMGAAADTLFHMTLKTIASTRMTYQDFSSGVIESGFTVGSGIFERDGVGDPIAFLSANGTAAGTLNFGAGSYVTN